LFIVPIADGPWRRADIEAQIPGNPSRPRAFVVALGEFGAPLLRIDPLNEACRLVLAHFRDDRDILKAVERA
jgi:hypothetical protein